LFIELESNCQKAKMKSHMSLKEYIEKIKYKTLKAIFIFVVPCIVILD